MLINKIKQDQIQARKDRTTEKATLLTTLLGEASMPGKNDGSRDSTDEEVLAVIKKFVKNANEVIKNVGVSSDAGVHAQAEIDVLEQYLPQQMSDDELKTVIQSVIDDGGLTSAKDLGRIMGYLKSQHAGLYDGKKASQFAKEQLG